MSLSEASISCPYCGERIGVLVDAQEVGQSYIEDCQVCCRPITFLVLEDGQGDVGLQVYDENDVIQPLS